MTYAEKLKDPRWQKRRLEIMNRDDFTCRNCGETTRTLNVDHKIYRKGCDPWNYLDNDLWTLCEDCHKEITDKRQDLADQIGRMNSYELDRAEHLLKYIPLLDEVLIILRDTHLAIPYDEFVSTIDRVLKLKEDGVF